MVLYERNLRDYNPSDPYVLKYSKIIKDAITHSTSLLEAQNKIKNIIEEAFTDQKSIDDPIRDIAMQELRTLEERLRRMLE